MIECFYSERFCRFLRQGPLGTSIDGFAGLLVKQGYTKWSCQPRIRLVGALSEWLEHRKINVHELNEQRIADYLKARCQKLCLTSLEEPTLALLLKHLRQTGVIPQPLPPPDCPLDLLVRDYARFLGHERGLAEITIKYHRHITRRFLSGRFGVGKIQLNKLRVQDVTQFILCSAATLSPAGVHTVACVLRSFLGFLYREGRLASNLAGAVPPVANRYASEPPQTMTPGQIRRLLTRCERQSYTGKRDYAILLFLARLGLRGCEVVRLTLDDINWEAGELLIRGKGGRQDRLPLFQEVGEALTDYLRQRPAQCLSRRVFLRHKAPREGFFNSGTVSDIVRQALIRAGLHPRQSGAYLLRHSLATNLLRRGTTLHQIGQVLRHQHIRTTEIYAKVDLSLLRAVASPWPGGAQ